MTSEPNRAVQTPLSAGCAGLAAYGLVVVMTVLASLGFAATHIGDTVSTRGAKTTERAALTAKITRLEAERASLTFTPTTAQAVRAAEVARDQECGRVG